MNKLTTEQIRVLSKEFNLADGHAYRSWNDCELEVINEISSAFLNLDRKNAEKLESDYIQTFFKLSEQSYRPDRFAFPLCFTASAALEVIGNYLRIQKMSVALMEPCFDNLHDILVRHTVPTSVFPEHLLETDVSELQKFLQTFTSDALFLVSPNNPTGVTLKKENLECIVEYCKSSQTLLIIDATFRFYLPLGTAIDQYGLIADADIDCILIEDTGKTWPTLEIKAPFFSVSHRLRERILGIYADFLLHVSPVAVQLLTRFLNLDHAHGLGHIHAVVATNRRVLYEQLEGTFLQPTETPWMSVAWLRIDSAMTSTELKAHLAGHGVHTLAGHQFFWSTPQRGDQYLRIALSRNPTMFNEATLRIGAALRLLQLD